VQNYNKLGIPCDIGGNSTLGGAGGC